MNSTIKHLGIISIFLIFVCGNKSLSQNTDSYVGTAVGKNIEDVKISALQNLIQQIQVFVTSKITTEKIETNTTYKDSLFNNTIAQSFMSLTDVQETIEKIDGDNFKVTKTVSRKSVQKMFDARRKRILDYLHEAERTLTDASTHSTVALQTALDNYYQAYLISLTYPDTVSAVFNSKPSSVGVGIPNMLDEIARSIEFIPIKQIDDEYIVWKYKVRYKDKEIFSMRYSFFDGMGQSEGVVQNGETQITVYYSKKEKKERQIQVQLEFLSADELDNTLSTAKKFLNTTPLQKTISVSVPGEKIISKFAQKLPTGLEGLLKAKMNFENTKNELDRLIKKGIIVQGKASDFETLNGLYCVVVDNPGLVALLKNTNNKYYDYLSNKNVELKEYTGKRIMWFEVLKK